MDPELVKKALEALENGDDAGAMEILKGLIVSAASGDPVAEGDEPGAEGDGAEGVADPPTAENAIDPKVIPASETSDDEEDDDPKKKMARKALRTMLCRLTNTSNFAQALVQVQTFRDSHLTLESERQALSMQRATLESAERRQLVVELIRLGAEFPATVWADSTAAKPSKMKARWNKMPIAELRAHVVDQRTARGKGPTKTAVSGARPPAGDAQVNQVNELGLTPSQVKICEETGCDPKDFIALSKMQSKHSDLASFANEEKARRNRVEAMVTAAMRPWEKTNTEEGN